MLHTTCTQVGIRSVCHVCTREEVRTQPRTPGGYQGLVCTPCLRIDSALGRLAGGSLLTPVDDLWARGDRVVHHGLNPDDDGVDDRVWRHHRRRVVTMSDAVKESTGQVISARFPGGQDTSRTIWMDGWQRHYAPGPGASAEGYVEYIEAVHPWARQFVPVQVDLQKLENLTRHRA